MKLRKNYNRRVTVYSPKCEPKIYVYNSGVAIKLPYSRCCLSKSDLRYLLLKASADKVDESFIKECMKHRTRSELFLMLCKLIDPFYCSCCSDEDIISNFYVVIVYDDDIIYYITCNPDKYVYL